MPIGRNGWNRFNKNVGKMQMRRRRSSSSSSSSSGGGGGGGGVGGAQAKNHFRSIMGKTFSIVDCLVYDEDTLIGA